MSTYLARDIARDATSMATVLSREPAIMPDFSDIDLQTLVAVMYFYIGIGINNANNVHGHLDERNCPYGFSVITSLLKIFEGSDADYHLWQVDGDGTYHLLSDDDWDDFPPAWA